MLDTTRSRPTGSFQVAGRLTVSLDGLPPSARDAVAAHLDPCPPAAAGATPDVVVLQDGDVADGFVDLQRDAGDGRLTATDGRRFYILEQGRACELPPLGVLPARFRVEPGFPMGRAFGRLLRPALQLALVARGAAVAHAAAVEVDGRAVLVGGWSESGKTETALALVERGARFLSDKWTVLGDDAIAHVFPIGVGVRGWTLAYLPRLDAALAARDRRRLQAAAMARTFTRPLRGGPLGGGLERVMTLADRISVSPSGVRRLYRDDPAAPWEAPLRAVALLTTVPDDAGVRVTRASAGWAAERLATTADFERRGAFELHDRARWAVPGTDPDVRRRAAEDERALLERALAAVPVLDVRAPFPTDPRQVAEAIEREF